MTSPPTRPAPPRPPTRASSRSWAPRRPRVPASSARSRPPATRPTRAAPWARRSPRATCSAASPRASPTPRAASSRSGPRESVPVATREQAQAILRKPQGAIFSTPDEVVAPQQAPGIRPLPLLPPLTVLDLVTMATTDSTSVKWVREASFTNGAAEVAESAAGAEVAKPEAALTLEPVTFDVTTIAHWMPASKQSLRDVAGVRSLIDAKLEWGLRRRLARQLINGDGIGPNLLGICNTPGIGHVDRSGADAASLIEDIYDGVVHHRRRLRRGAERLLRVPRRLQGAPLRPRQRAASSDGHRRLHLRHARSGQPDRGRGLPRAPELRPAGRHVRSWASGASSRSGCTRASPSA